MSLPPDFSEFLKLLNCHHVDYLLVVAAIRAFGFNTPNLTEDLFLQRRRIVRMGHPPIRIEVMNEIDGVTFEECRPAAILAFIDGIQVPIISLADLKRNKLASGRPKDIDDLQQLP